MGLRKGTGHLYLKTGIQSGVGGEDGGSGGGSACLLISEAEVRRFLWVQDQPVLQSKFQDGQDYTGKPCL